MAKRTTMTVDLPPQLKRDIVRVAKQEHLKPSDVVRRAVYAYIAANLQVQEKVA